MANKYNMGKSLAILLAQHRETRKGIWAERLNVTASRLSLWQKRSVLQPDEVVSICEVFGVDLSTFIMLGASE